MMNDRLGGAINDVIGGWLCCASAWVRGAPVHELSALGHEDFSYSLPVEEEQGPAMHFDDVRLAQDAIFFKAGADRKRIQAQEDMFRRMREHEDMCQRIRAQERLRFLQLEKDTPRSWSTSAGDSWPEREQSNAAEVSEGAGVVDDWQRSLAEAIAFADQGSLADAIALADQRGQALSAHLRPAYSSEQLEGASVVEDWQRSLAEAVAFAAETGAPSASAVVETVPLPGLDEVAVRNIEAAAASLEVDAATTALPASSPDAHGHPNLDESEEAALVDDEGDGAEDRLQTFLTMHVDPQYHIEGQPFSAAALGVQPELEAAYDIHFDDDVALADETPLVKPPPLPVAGVGATGSVAKASSLPDAFPRAPTDYSMLPPGHVLRGVLPVHLVQSRAGNEESSDSRGRSVSQGASPQPLQAPPALASPPAGLRFGTRESRSFAFAA